MLLTSSYLDMSEPGSSRRTRRAAAAASVSNKPADKAMVNVAARSEPQLATATRIKMSRHQAAKLVSGGLNETTTSTTMPPDWATMTTSCFDDESRINFEYCGEERRPPAAVAPAATTTTAAALLILSKQRNSSIHPKKTTTMSSTTRRSSNQTFDYARHLKHNEDLLKQQQRVFAKVAGGHNQLRRESTIDVTTIASGGSGDREMTCCLRRTSLVDDAETKTQTSRVHLMDTTDDENFASSSILTKKSSGAGSGIFTTTASDTKTRKLLKQKV